MKVRFIQHVLEDQGYLKLNEIYDVIRKDNAENYWVLVNGQEIRMREDEFEVVPDNFDLVAKMIEDEDDKSLLEYVFGIVAEASEMIDEDEYPEMFEALEKSVLILNHLMSSIKKG